MNTPANEATDTLVIPSSLNMGLSLLTGICALSLLYFVSHTEMLWQKFLGAIAFSYVNNTVFSLLHESVHGLFHPKRWVNDLFGRWLAAFFPTGFSLQRFFHLGHHRRNRSPAEQFDYISPGQNVYLKNAVWYGILTGVYWLLPPLSSLLYLIPGLYSSKLFHQDEEDRKWSQESGAAAMIAEVEKVSRPVASLEIIFAIAWQSAIFHFLDLNWMGWGLCYAAFAINWSSLQYADHAWTELDPVHGAWNLRVTPIIRWIFLNYHHHRVHHENPKIPWIHLSRLIDPNEPKPSFLKIYLSMWKGPRPLPKTDKEGHS